MLRALILSLAILTLTACGGDDSTGGGTPDVVKPSKESIVALLRTLEGAMTAKNYEAAAACLYPIEEIEPADMPKILKSDPVTKTGIDLIAARGKFGTLTEIAGADSAEYFAKKAKVEVTDLYALQAEGAEIAVHFDGKRLRFIRINNLHKLR